MEKNMLRLVFNDVELYTTGVEHNDDLYFDLNDVYHASGCVKVGQRPSQWRNKLSKRYQDEGLLVNLSVGKNAYRDKSNNLTNISMFGTKEVVVAYAQWLDKDFAYIVNKAFSLLVDGKVDEAYLVAKTVASFNREYARESYKGLCVEIEKTFEKHQFKFSDKPKNFTYRNLNNVLWKYATNTPLPKEHSKSLRDDLVKAGRYKEAIRLDSGTHVLIALIKMGADYDQIKLGMGIK